MLTVDDAIDRVVAKVGMDGVNQGMSVKWNEWSLAREEMRKRPGRDDVGRATRKSRLDERIYPDSSLRLRGPRRAEMM